MAARGARARSFGCRPWQERSNDWPMQDFDDFYDGDVAARQARGLSAAGSPLTAADLAAHTSTWGDPIATDYRGVRVTTHPPNSSGPVALEIINVLEQFEPPPPPRSARPGSPTRAGSISGSRRRSSRWRTATPS